MDKCPASRLKRDLGAIMADGASFSVMVGLGETYLAAFVLALGLGERAAGLIAAAPMLAGAVLQMAAPWAVQKLQSRRRWVVACASLQAFSLLLVAAIAFSGGRGRWLVFVAATLYWAAGMATGPAWNVWVAQIVPTYLRPTFFARRARVGHVGVLLGFIAGGVALQVGEQNGAALFVFAVLFTAAGGFRFFSAAMLAMQSEPRPTESREAWRVRDLTAKHDGDPFWRVLIYLLFVQFSVHLSSPFFTPFMISHLELSYAGYASLIAMALGGKIIAMHWLGDLAARMGPRKLLWIAGLSITPLSGAWLFSQSFAYLATLQVLGGFAWAAYELAMLLVFFDAIPSSRRTAVLTLYNLGNAVAIALGAFAGAALLGAWGETRDVYLTLFVLSSLGRLASLTILPRAPQRLPQIAPVTRTLAVRPEGTLERPVLAGSPQTDEAPAVTVAPVRDEPREIRPAVETSA